MTYRPISEAAMQQLQAFARPLVPSIAPDQTHVLELLTRPFEGALLPTPDDAEEARKTLFVAAGVDLRTGGCAHVWFWELSMACQALRAVLRLEDDNALLGAAFQLGQMVRHLVHAQVAAGALTISQEGKPSTT